MMTTMKWRWVRTDPGTLGEFVHRANVGAMRPRFVPAAVCERECTLILARTEHTPVVFFVLLHCTATSCRTLAHSGILGTPVRTTEVETFVLFRFRQATNQDLIRECLVEFPQVRERWLW
jgi:hypothetical protein